MTPENRRYQPLAGALLFLASTAGGCLGEPEPVDTLPRVAVSGSVTFDGKPLPAGKIQFQPMGTEPAAAAVGEIEDGKFSIARPVGPSPGKYRVMISSRATPKVAPGGQPGGANLEPEKIPQQYNTRSRLEIDIPAEGPLTCEFPLSTRP